MLYMQRNIIYPFITRNWFYLFLQVQLMQGQHFTPAFFAKSYHLSPPQSAKVKSQVRENYPTASNTPPLPNPDYNSSPICQMQDNREHMQTQPIKQMPVGENARPQECKAKFSPILNKAKHPPRLQIPVLEFTKRGSCQQLPTRLEPQSVRSVKNGQLTRVLSQHDLKIPPPVIVKGHKSPPCRFVPQEFTRASPKAKVQQKKLLQHAASLGNSKNRGSSSKLNLESDIGVNGIDIEGPKLLNGFPRSKMVNGFQIGSVLGRGKFGEVFLARHQATGFIAAIKKIERGRVQQLKMTDQLAKQIRLHSCLDHPNIVKFYGVFREKEEIYMVMEYMNAGTLFDQLNRVTAIPIRETVGYLSDIIDALTYMHERSIAHRDIKPENIVISTEGVAKLCDFGWSAVLQTSRKTYCGTLDYAAPEVVQRKNYDASIDIWCIGVLAYELLTGHVPFEGEERMVIQQKIVDKNRIVYPEHIPGEAREFIDSLVQKDPSLRPKCHELLKFRLFTMHLSRHAVKTKKMA